MTTYAVSLRARFAVAIVAALSLLAIALVHTGAADAKKPKKGPAGAKFYKPPKHLPKKHGKLIWFRQAKGVVPLTEAKRNDNVLYSSRSTDGSRIAVSGTVSVPKGKPPKGGWPVISYAHGTTGSADACAPSRNTRAVRHNRTSRTRMTSSMPGSTPATRSSAPTTRDSAPPVRIRTWLASPRDAACSTSSRRPGACT